MTESPLSEREQELLKLVATGASNKEISYQLFISINTVKVHLRNIYTKLEVASRTEAAMWAVQNGLVDAGGGEGVGAAPRSEDGTELSRFRTWFEQLTPLTRFGLVTGLALFLVIIGFGVSLLFQPSPRSLTPEEAALVASIDENRWKQLAELPTARSGFASAVYDNQVYAISGEGDVSVLGENERYDPLTDSWESLNAKPIPVADVQAGVIGGRIYIPGGRLADGSVTDVLEIYDPRQNSWLEGASLPVPLSAYALSTFEGKIFVFGGWDGEKYLNSVFMYDPSQETWTGETPMPTARGYAGAAMVNDLIYVIGGKNEHQILNINEVYSPIAEPTGDNPWSEAIALQDGWEYIAVVSVSETLYVFAKNDQNITAIQEFTPINNSWGTIESSVMPLLTHFESISLGSRIQIIGGRTEDQLVKTNSSIKILYTISIPIVK